MKLSSSQPQASFFRSRLPRSLTCRCVNSQQQHQSSNNNGNVLMQKIDGGIVVTSGEAFQKSASSSPRFSLLRALSASIELQAVNGKFETFAGRAAMLGVSVAFFQELVLKQTVVPLHSSMTIESFTISVVTTIFTSACYALMISSSSFAEQQGQGAGQGDLLLEGVIASLTSIHRSRSSITSPANSALDEVVDKIILGLDLSADDQ